MKDTQNCPYCQSEVGITQPWGLSPQGWTNIKIIHDEQHNNENRHTRTIHNTNTNL